MLTVELLTGLVTAMVDWAVANAGAAKATNAIATWKRAFT
jgi:hypothetical protein